MFLKVVIFLGFLGLICGKDEGKLQLSICLLSSNARLITADIVQCTGTSSMKRLPGYSVDAYALDLVSG